MDSSKFDALMKLADFWVRRHDARRGFEWKLTVGLWAVILAGIHERPQWHGYKCLPAQTMPILLSIVTFLLYYVLWMRPLWERNKMDREQGFSAADEAKKLLLCEQEYTPSPLGHNDVKRSWWLFMTDWSVLFQSAATLLLLTVFCLMTWPS
jgi:hypothetical protein